MRDSQDFLKISAFLGVGFTISIFLFPEWLPGIFGLSSSSDETADVSSLSDSSSVLLNDELDSRSSVNCFPIASSSSLWSFESLTLSSCLDGPGFCSSSSTDFSFSSNSSLSLFCRFEGGSESLSLSFFSFSSTSSGRLDGPASSSLLANFSSKIIYYKVV